LRERPIRLLVWCRSLTDLLFETVEDLCPENPLTFVSSCTLMERKVYCCGVSINQEFGIRTDGCADYVSSVLVGDPVGGLLALLLLILMRILSDDLGDNDTLLANWSEVNTVWWQFFLSRIMIRVGEAMGLRGFWNLEIYC
jgi:hypothetical protein